MGREAICDALIDGKADRGKAHLDSKSLRFTGSRRLNFAIADMHGVVASSGMLTFQSPEGPVSLDIGDAAAAWAKAILQPKSLLQRLGVKADMRVCSIGVADSEFAKDLGAFLARVQSTSFAGTNDVIFLGIECVDDLQKISQAKQHLANAGGLWIVYRKGKNAAVGEALVRAALLKAGLVETKVVSFSDTHTATRGVVPLSERKAP